MIARGIEKILFASRWLLAPLYLALVLGLVALLVKASQEVLHLGKIMTISTEADVILALLGLIDMTLTGALVIIVIFSGYENFVSRIDASQHPDWPTWMSKIDFTGLKLKLLSSIVAISAVQLLRAFMNLQNTSDRDLAWYVGIHLTFLVSGLVLALTDKVSGESGH